MDPEIQKLVCENCWQTVFAIGSFRAAWTALNTPGSNGFTYVTPPWEQMQRSIDRMCEWCDLVSEEIEVYYQHTTKKREPPSAHATFRLTVRFERRTPKSTLYLRLEVENSWKPAYVIHTIADDRAAQFIAAREIVQQVDSRSSYDLALQCIADCSSHERCPKPVSAALPTRVIDCTSPSQPRLFISDGKKDYYSALSYVWGEGQPHKTTTENLTSYIAGIKTKYIPKTISDAITVTQRLGLRYLWVDAFCIIQNSDEDKAREIAQMRSIFRNSYITIIAASSERVSEGFLHNRPAWYPSPSTLPFRCPDGTLGTMLLRGGSDASSEPVNTRAWCLEERVLSPRALIYCSHTLQFECQTTHMNINGAPNFITPRDGIPRLPDRVFVPMNSPVTGEDREMRKAWTEILGIYTRRALTKPRDRLLALSGVVEIFHRFWQGQYIAGLWAHQLPGCLLWTKSRAREYPRPDYRAPSWSWAAVDGEIASYTISNKGIICSIERCEVALARQINPYGEVTGGSIVLRAIIRKVLWDPLESELFEIEGTHGGQGGVSEPFTDESRSERGEIGYVTADAMETVSENKCEVFVVVFRDSGTSLLGLVLELVTDEAEECERAVGHCMATYRRVGFFTAPFCDKLTWLSTPYQSVKII